MLDEMKDRYEQIKDDLEPKVDKRLLECGLKELDYIEFLNDQEFTQITLIMKAVQDDKAFIAYGMCKQLLDDIVCYGQLINDARDYNLNKMECHEASKHFEDYMNRPELGTRHTHATAYFVSDSVIDGTDKTPCMYDYAEDILNGRDDIAICKAVHKNSNHGDCAQCTEPCCSQSGVNNK